MQNFNGRDYDTEATIQLLLVRSGCSELTDAFAESRKKFYGVPPNPDGLRQDVEEWSRGRVPYHVMYYVYPPAECDLRPKDAKLLKAA